MDHTLAYQTISVSLFGTCVYSVLGLYLIDIGVASYISYKITCPNTIFSHFLIFFIEKMDIILGYWIQMVPVWV